MRDKCILESFNVLRALLEVPIDEDLHANEFMSKLLSQILLEEVK